MHQRDRDGSQRPRIAVVLAQLSGAGIQRMRLNIIDSLLARGYDVDLVVGKNEGALASHIPDEVTVYALGESGKRWIFTGFLSYLRNNRPSHILSSYEDLSAMVIVANCLLGSPAVVLASTHNALSKVRDEGSWLTRLKWRLLIPSLGLLYRRAAVVAVSQGAAQDLSAATGLQIDRVQVIYNPVINTRFESDFLAPPPPDLPDFGEVPVIGFFGRFHAQKRVEDLLRAFARVRRTSACRLLLVGEGGREAALRALVRELDLDSDVIFYGFAQNPFPVMKTCAVTVLPSEYEGLGNVLIESLACGVQVISTDCPFGPAEILENGKWGQLVPVGDVAALETAIRKSLDKTFRVEPEQLKTRGMQFSADRATEQYLDALGLPHTC